MPVTIGGSGPITGVTSINTSVSDTELGYLDGVTSALQTQLAGKADTTGNGAWTSYTPTVTSASGSFTTVSGTGRYVQLGKLVVLMVKVTITTNGTAAGNVKVSLPVSSRASTMYVGSGREDNSTGVMTQFYVAADGFSYFLNTNGTYPGGNNYVLNGTVTYEAA